MTTFTADTPIAVLPGEVPDDAAAGSCGASSVVQD
jgi:hypothetical protein